MKKILAVTLALAATSSAFADRLIDAYGSQRQETGGDTSVAVADKGSRHMVEFNAESLPSLIFSFKKDKTPDETADNGTDLKLGLNYAYGVHRFLQAAARFNYGSGAGSGSFSDTENFNIQVGGYLNSDSDFSRATYLSAFIGAGYEQDFGNEGEREDVRIGSIAIGKRIPLDRFGIQHVVYTPEVALTNTNSTTDKSFDYRQAVELRLLQFSAFF